MPPRGALEPQLREDVGMDTVLGIRLEGKIQEEVAGLRPLLEPMASGRWHGAAGLYVHLLELGPVPPDRDDGVALAVAKAANATQSFAIGLRGIEFGNVTGRPSVYLKISHKPGMLQSLAFSVAGWLPADVVPHHTDPWIPALVLAEFDRHPPKPTQLQMEVAVSSRSWGLDVRQIQVLRRGDDGTLETLHVGKLPGAAV